MTRTHMHAFANVEPDTLARLERILAAVEATEALACEPHGFGPSPWDGMTDLDIVATCQGER